MFILFCSIILIVILTKKKRGGSSRVKRLSRRKKLVSRYPRQKYDVVLKSSIRSLNTHIPSSQAVREALKSVAKRASTRTRNYKRKKENIRNRLLKKLCEVAETDKSSLNNQSRSKYLQKYIQDNLTEIEKMFKSLPEPHNSLPDDEYFKQLIFETEKSSNCRRESPTSLASE